MDLSSLRALNPKFFPMGPFRLRSLIRPALLADYKSRRAAVHSQTNGTSGPIVGASSDKILQVVLVSPQIAGNTGCIARTCAASAVGLHLVEPLGYKVDDTKLKRAGLDYWPYVMVKIHGSWTEFREYFALQEGEKRLLAFTKRGTNIHSEFSYRRGDWLVFGSETCGLPPDALQDCIREGMGGGTIRIPMVETYVRCLNLSVSVGISLYEAARQLNYQQLQFPAANEDYINPYDFSSRINAVIVPEFIAQGILSGLFLLTWQLIPFIIMAPISYYHLQMFWKKKHLIDVTEIFRQIEGQKKYRMVKLAFYFTMFILVIYRLVLCAVTLIINDDDESPLISGIY
ncbi:hypothetical protein KSP40_PGU014390 [Platanthera guangdongensis]|uniref:tRNA/rRNA methyltransferase SpoU type domain-containing protein n=1 Tax=Platanthera guangdongensis TaxID=2320717 RepID=A0ABR2MJX9_9ASPA